VHRLDRLDALAVAGLIKELAAEQLVHLAWCTEHGRYSDWFARKRFEIKPPAEALDAGITFWSSLTLRRTTRPAGT
jgi:hypothetical protein